MQRSEFTFPSRDGKTSIHAVEWRTEEPPRAVLQIAHGVSEYIARYEPTARWMAERGIAVVGNDHLGHGQSVAPGAPRLFFGPQNGWPFALDDLRTLHTLELGKFPDIPHFLLGFSMGSFLARSYLIRYPDDFSGAMILGTGQMNAPSLAYCRLIARRELRRVGPEQTSDVVNQLSFDKYNRIFSPTRTAYDWLSADKENVDSYIADPLCGGSASVGLCREILLAMAAIRKPENLRRMNPAVPVLFASGDRDPVGDCGAGVKRAFRSFRRAGVRDVSCRLYPGARHEILNDTCREEVRRDLLAWMEARIPQK